MQLPLGGNDGVATLGPQLKIKKNTFQGVVVQLRDVNSVPTVLTQLRALGRLRKAQRLPNASRVRTATHLHPSVLQQTLLEENERTQKKTMYRPSEDLTVAEDWDDDGEVGVGDRLLHLLQRWQVENVLLVVARQDDSLSGRLIGQELFKLMLETAKLALEQYYLANIKPSDAAKLEIFEAEQGTAQYIVSPRAEPSDNSQKQHHRASVCLMTSDTIESWPQHHQPTSDGGGRQVTKKGRVNHFLYDRKSSAQLKAYTEISAPTVSGNNVTESSLPQQNDDTDALLACEGIDWLGITREEWLKLRTIRVPVKELHYLLMCLVVLVEKPLEKKVKSTPTPKQDEEFTSPSYSWNRCREVLQQSAQWSEKLRPLHGSSLTRSQVKAIRSVLQEPTMNESAFVRICSASVKLFSWIKRLLDEFDEHEMGIASLSTPSPISATLTPQPPPSQPRKVTKQSIAFSGISPEESALVRELNALANAKITKIVDRGRLLSHKQLH